MTDNRFPTPGQDTRFATPGADARFPSPGQDTRFPTPGTDTRFQGDLPPPPDPPTTEGPFDGRDWQDLPVGGTFCDLTAYGWFNVDRFQYLFQFRTPRGPVDDRGRYTFRLEEDGELATTFAFRPDQLPTTVELSFQSIRPNTSRLTVTTNNGDVILFDVRVPIFTGPGQFAPPGFAPAVRTPPDLDLSPDNNTLLYTPGVWAGELAPTVTARLFVDGADTAPAVPSMPVQPAWRGKECGVREAATNAAGGPVFALSPEVMPPAPPPDLDAEVQAILAGRAGCVFDLTDWSTMTEDNGATIPITQIGQMIGTVSSKWGTLVYRFGQGTLARRPSVVAGGALFDGVDDSMVGDLATLSFAADAARLTAGISVTPAAVGGSRHPLYFSQPATTSNRFDFLINPGANVRGLARRLAADTFGDVISPALATANEEHVLFMQADYAQTNQLVLRIDGAEIGTDSIPGIAGTNADPAQSATATLGSARPGSNPHNGKIKRIFLARFLLTEAERQIVEAWLGEDV